MGDFLFVKSQKDSLFIKNNIFFINNEITLFSFVSYFFINYTTGTR